MKLEPCNILKLFLDFNSLELRCFYRLHAHKKVCKGKIRSKGVTNYLGGQGRRKMNLCNDIAIRNRK